MLTAAFPGSLFAQSISESDAKNIAQNFFAKMSGQSFRAVSDEPSEEKNVPLSATGQNNDTLYYVVNNANNTGFVIVAADERVWPILGYSLHGEFNAENQPPAFVNWMENRKKEIEFIKQNQTLPESTVAEQWENLNDATPILKSTATSVAPLLQTTWNQGCFYNELCPVDSAGPCDRVWAGCTATAMAQIMKYWGFPSTGTGSYSYNHPTYGTQSANFSATTYQWSQMPNNVTEANNAVATLLYHCGVAVNMNYSPTGSGAGEPSDELVEYFGYSPNAQFVEKNDYTEIEWINLLKSELNLKRPIWYDGFNPSSGHAFICDGYREDDYFHFNWGWGGYADGYFYLGSLNAIPDQEGYDFTDDQGAVINVFPSDLPDGYNGFFISGNNFEIEPFGGDESLLVFSSTNWTASSNQSWLSLNSSSGLSGKSTLQFVAEKNETGNTRSAEITISVLGHDNQIVEISQSSDSIVNVTPGELYSQISTFLSNLEYLTINGSIDARDFQIMRDSIPNLKGIDLSNASIVSYTGTFGTSGTSTVTYPANQIPDYAFNKPVSNSGKPSLETIILPNTVVSIGNYAFYRCSGLKSFPTSSSITTIGKFAFYRCTGLRSIVLPSGLTTINSYAFYYCTESDSIYIPSSVALIDDNVFRDFSGLINVDPNNNVYSSEDGVLFNKNKTTLILCPTSKEGHYYVPSNVTTINNSAFYKCSKLTSIVLPTNLTTIGSE
ncbi:MAG TPA: C10 family peptidase, partial [Prolixibacteraceae bacterium]|nr:C10 family peptidase [Prolixibacteraceae bacterium]